MYMYKNTLLNILLSLLKNKTNTNNIGRHSTFKATSGSRQYHKSRKNIYTLVHGYLFFFFSVP